MTEQEMQMKLALQQGKVNALRQEVAEMNEEREYWTKLHHQAAIAAMQIVADDGDNVRNEQHLIAKYAVQIADALIAELKKGGQDEN